MQAHLSAPMHAFINMCLTEYKQFSSFWYCVVYTHKQDREKN